eukprot:2244406-Pleurochrysis_carterae.AAC.4
MELECEQAGLPLVCQCRFGLVKEVFDVRGDEVHAQAKDVRQVSQNDSVAHDFWDGRLDFLGEGRCGFAVEDLLEQLGDKRCVAQFPRAALHADDAKSGVARRACGGAA